MGVQPRAETPGRETRLRFVRQALRLAGPYWSSERKWRVRGIALGLFLLTGAQVGLTVWGNYWNRDLFDALEARSVRGVVVQVGVFALIFLTSIAVTAAHLLVKRRLQLDWRAWLTERLIGRWMAIGRHYRPAIRAGRARQPGSADRRRHPHCDRERDLARAHARLLAADARPVRRDPVDGVGVDQPSATARSACPATWCRSRSCTRGRARCWAICSAARWCARPTLCRPPRRTSGSAWRARASTRRRSRSCTASRSSAAAPRTRFARIVRDWDRQSLAYMGLVSFSTGYGGLLPVFPLLVAAPQYISGAMSLGVLMQAAQAFQRLTSALSWPVDNVGEIANCRTSTERVLSLDAGRCERLDAEARAPSRQRIELVQSEEDRTLAIDDLCIAEPSGQILLEHCSGEIRRGERVLIGGDPARDGQPLQGDRRTVAVGQRARDAAAERWHPVRAAAAVRCPEGTLREALCYPRPADAFARGRAPPGARVRRPRLARAPARRAGQVGAGPAAARAAAARHRARAAAAPGLGVHGGRDRRARSEARAADPRDADRELPDATLLTDQLPPRARAAVPAQARAARASQRPRLTESAAAASPARRTRGSTRRASSRSGSSRRTSPR